MNVRWFGLILAGLCGASVASGQTGPTQQSVEAKLKAPFLLLRGLWSCNNLQFDAQGNLIGSCASGSLSASAMVVKSVKLTDRRLEIKGSRSDLQFAPGGSPDGPAAVNAVHFQNMTVSVERDPANPQALDAVLDKIFATGFDDALATEAPVYWRGWIRHQLHPETPVYPNNAAAIEFRKDSGVTAPRLVYAPDPTFTDEARRKKYSGVCVLDLIVDRDGRPTDLAIVRPIGMGLDDKAIAAVSRYEFAPATKDGQPVAVLIKIEVRFRIY